MTYFDANELITYLNSYKLSDKDMEDKKRLDQLVIKFFVSKSLDITDEEINLLADLYSTGNLKYGKRKVTSIKLPKGFVCIPNVPNYTIQMYEDSQFYIYHMEFGYNTGKEQFEKELMWVATYNETTKIARPTHGFFPPHPTGKKLKKYFESINYLFDHR